MKNASSFTCSKTTQNVQICIDFKETNIKLLEKQRMLKMQNICCIFNFGNNINQRNLISREHFLHQLMFFVCIFLNNESLSP